MLGQVSRVVLRGPTGPAWSKQRRKFRISKIHGQTCICACVTTEALLHVVAWFDVVHILQKRHRPPFRDIITGEISRGVHDAEAIN